MTMYDATARKVEGPIVSGNYMQGRIIPPDLQRKIDDAARCYLDHFDAGAAVPIPQRVGDQLVQAIAKACR